MTVLFSNATNIYEAKNPKDSFSGDIEQIDANLYVNAHVIKLCFVDSSFGGTQNDEAIALKYTIDYPRIELNAHDT